MDLSPEYIKMCDCEEIQWVKPKQKGDIYYILIEQSVVDLNGEHIREEEQIEYYDCDGFEYGQSHKGGVCWHKNNGITTEYYQDEYGGRRTKKIIWLPRQDQLQAIGGHKLRFWDLYHHIRPESFNEDPDNYFGIFDTDEKMYLAYIMLRDYNKKWDGEKWV